MAVPRRHRRCYRRGNSCITSANGEFTTLPATSEDAEQKLDVSSVHEQIKVQRYGRFIKEYV